MSVATHVERSAAVTVMLLAKCRLAVPALEEKAIAKDADAKCQSINLSKRTIQLHLRSRQAAAEEIAQAIMI